MQVTPTDLDGVLVIEPTVHGDERGFFSESFNLRRFGELTGIERTWVQDNHSRSERNVLRGIHYQHPHPQGKLVRCVRGTVWDVAVDLRRSSPQFGCWFGVELSEENHRQLWVPEGFGHAFVTTSDVADVLYKTTDYYVPDAQHVIRWDDEQLAIDWPLDGDPILSERDAAAPGLSGADLPV